MRNMDFHAHPVPEAFRKWLPRVGIDVRKEQLFDANPKYADLRDRIYRENGKELLEK